MGAPIAEKTINLILCAVFNQEIRKKAGFGVQKNSGFGQ